MKQQQAGSQHRLKAAVEQQLDPAAETASELAAWHKQAEHLPQTSYQKDPDFGS